MSSVSITGNNRPSSFIVAWRWFPHGATGSLWCQPASPPQCIAGKREREQVEGIRQHFHFLMVLQGEIWRLALQRSYPRLLLCEQKPVSFIKSLNVHLCPHKVANWQDLSWRSVPMENITFEYNSEVLLVAWRRFSYSKWVVLAQSSASRIKRITSVGEYIHTIL